MPFGWKIAFFLAVAPQIYWYFLMWRGLVRMMLPGTTSSLSKSSQVQEDEYTRKKKYDDDVCATSPAPSDNLPENGAKEFAH